MADAQVVPEGAVLVLVGEDAEFVVVFTDLGEFHPDAGGLVLGLGEERGEREGDKKENLFHIVGHSFSLGVKVRKNGKYRKYFLSLRKRTK